MLEMGSNTRHRNTRRLSFTRTQILCTDATPTACDTKDTVQHGIHGSLRTCQHCLCTDVRRRTQRAAGSSALCSRRAPNAGETKSRRRHTQRRHVRNIRRRSAVLPGPTSFCFSNSPLLPIHYAATRPQRKCTALCSATWICFHGAAHSRLGERDHERVEERGKKAWAVAVCGSLFSVLHWSFLTPGIETETRLP